MHMNPIRTQLKAALKAAPLDAANQCTAEFCLSPEFIGFQGHFPGQPVLPGVCMICAVLVAAEDTLGMEIKMRAVKSAKFFSPVLPEQTVSMQLRFDSVPAPSEIRARLSRGNEKVAQITICVSVTKD